MAEPKAYASSLIQALRGTAGKGGNEGSGIVFLDNLGGMGGVLSPRDYSGMAFDPALLSHSLRTRVTPPKVTPTVGPVGGGGGNGSTVTLDTSTGGKKTIGNRNTTDTGAGESIVTIDTNTDGKKTIGSRSTIDTGAGSGGNTTAGAGTGGTGTGAPVIISTVANNKSKTDASHWGEGGDQIYSDPERVPTPYVEPTDLSGVRVVNVDAQPLNNDGSHWGKGSDVQEDPYNFGVLLSDMDLMPSASEQTIQPGDINGSDLQSDNYTFGVLQSDADPARELALLDLLLQLGGGGNGTKDDELDMYFI